ncbi:MAG: class I SAM-dependent DNA methyltransferase [Selenomonadaceae bacterium]|nr:class I SAM-dependent DNA methyltransferase [Selenomonadaceae bacterium]
MNVKNFVAQWQNVDGELANYQKFWSTLIRDIFDIDKPENFIKFNEPVQLEHTKFIDCYFPDSKVIIEQKNFGVDLEKTITQSDGTKLTPFEQARRYIIGLPLSMHPKKIITCNFKQLFIYDMETLEPPIKILLEDLPEKYHVLDFLIDKDKNKVRIELELSLKAGEIVAKIYDALLTQYINPNSKESLASLNKLCVRLIFCLYAESSGIFGKHKIFRDYLEGSRNIRRDLIDLFNVLNTPITDRDPYIDDSLKKFPYVNGGLFEGAIEIPNFTPEIKDLLLEEASSGFNWSDISPTIFGALFESTLNPKNRDKFNIRREGGMHYTSIENIHKVIDELFLDDLNEGFELRKRLYNDKEHWLDFQNKLASIKIFDPACGSGNFLTESYLSLRRLENKVLKELLGIQITFGGLSNPIKISIANFYGIEINDFAVAVAQTALWIAELQMMQETQAIIHRDLNFLPLKSYANIQKANALLVDWKKFAPEANYIIGNPPFVGKTYQTTAQKNDLIAVDKKLKPLDYVTGWYFKAIDFMKGNSTRTAFLSTNSITQGEQVGYFWQMLGGHIDFAHRTFTWDSESTEKAHVHCVVIGFSVADNPKPKKLFFDKQTFIIAKNINGYLMDFDNIYVEKRDLPLFTGVPIMIWGSKSTDGGNLIIELEDYDDFIKKEPLAAKFIRQYVGADEFINGKLRYCLWLVNATPAELRKMKLVYERVNACKEFRLASKKAATRKSADKSWLFQEIRQPTENYILIPVVSSERRKYIPMGFMPPEIIASAAVQTIPNATLYDFGILTSSIHMGWMRTVAGRLKSDYRYSATIVYNNFIWAAANSEQKARIEATAGKILEIRAKYPDSTLADLYDELTMPADLRRAHRQNDLAVAKLYGFEEIIDDEGQIVRELLRRYAELTKSPEK